jgi:hypothetical protein
LKNKYALSLIEKIQKELLLDKFNCDTTIEYLKKLREYSFDDQNPVLTKALRLAYEHLESNGAFLIGIPMDEPMDDSEKEFNFSETNDLESFEYFISLLLDLEKKNNILDLREYNKAFLAFA